MTASKEGLDLRPVKVSTISFVDLAGSERGSVSGYEGSKERIRQSEVDLELQNPFNPSESLSDYVVLPDGKSGGTADKVKTLDP